MDNDQPLIEPGKGIFRLNCSERVIFLPAGPGARILSVRFGAKRKRQRPYPARLYQLKRKGFDIDLVGPAMGAPIAGMVLEQLIAGGAKQVIMIGLGGSIDYELRIGDLLLVKEAISDEGTSRCYPKGKDAPGASAWLFEEIKRELDEGDYKYKVGKALSTDGIFQETRGKLSRFYQEGALAVEMELSALYTIAWYRRIELCGLLVISDELFGEEWKGGFKSPKILLALIQAGKIALSVLAR